MVVGPADPPGGSEPTVATKAPTPFGSPQAVWCKFVIQPWDAASSGDWPDWATVSSVFSCAVAGPPGVIRAFQGRRALVHVRMSVLPEQVIAYVCSASACSCPTVAASTSPGDATASAASTVIPRTTRRGARIAGQYAQPFRRFGPSKVLGGGVRRASGPRCSPHEHFWRFRRRSVLCAVLRDRNRQGDAAHANVDEHATAFRAMSSSRSPRRTASLPRNLLMW